ncbi:MAG: hypothetical protein AAF253_13435 [Pseudomonadota bacterium]
MRLRQLVIAAETLDTADTLRAVLGLGEPFPDPGVAAFGLVNAVFALGDQFLEVVGPTTDDAPARRFIQRGGEGGYMAIFETGDIAGFRGRVDALGIRRVWEIDLDDIAATHLHPADLGAAIVSVDQPVPAGAWRWGGPDWQANSVPGAFTGAAFESLDPARLAGRWADALGLSTEAEGETVTIPLEGGQLRFSPGPADRLTVFETALPDPDAALSRASDMGLERDRNRIRVTGVDLVLSRL